MDEASFKYVFGPVLSRRLGRSLGVDVVPFKTCTYDCVYCQLGRTTQHTTERKSYVPREDVLDEIRRTLASGAPIDYITIAGSGEPTLYAGLGSLISGIKAMTAIPVAVLTNGARLGDIHIQDDLLQADVVVPSFDAGDAASFERVNRPCGGITFESMLEGLVAFRRRYRGQLWLEVFVVHGMTDTDEEIRKIASHLSAIRPDRVQVNTLARPAPGAQLLPASREDLDRFAKMLGFNAEVVAQDFVAPHDFHGTIGPEDVLGVIKRHPCSLQDIADGLGIDVDEASAHVCALLERNAIREEIQDGLAFYLARNE